MKPSRLRSCIVFAVSGLFAYCLTMIASAVVIGNDFWTLFGEEKFSILLFYATGVLVAETAATLCLWWCHRKMVSWMFGVLIGITSIILVSVGIGLFLGLSTIDANPLIMIGSMTLMSLMVNLVVFGPAFLCFGAFAGWWLGRADNNTGTPQAAD